jgi:ribosome-binding factor A
MDFQDMSRIQSSGPSQRQLRVGEQVRHALSETLQRGEIIDPVVETPWFRFRKCACLPT